MLAKKRRRYTRAEYFAHEAQVEHKSEYFHGEIVAMAGASLNHNLIAGNIHSFLNNLFRSKSCESFIGDVRLWIEKKDFYTYPDVIVICGRPEFVPDRTDTVINPIVIIEVLSESTAGYDRGEKFQAYWTLDNFEEYVLVDQYRMRVEYFKRVSKKEWRLRVLTNADDILALESIEVEMPLAEIYRNVIWAEDE